MNYERIRSLLAQAQHGGENHITDDDIESVRPPDTAYVVYDHDGVISGREPFTITAYLNLDDASFAAKVTGSFVEEVELR